MARGSIFTLLRGRGPRRFVSVVATVLVVYYVFLVAFPPSQVADVEYSKISLDIEQVNVPSIPQLAPIKVLPATVPAEVTKPIEPIRAGNDFNSSIGSFIKKLPSLAEEMQAVDVGRSSRVVASGNVTLKDCPSIELNTGLVGHTGQGSLLIEDLSEADIVSAHPDILPGGSWAPTDCVATSKVAIIIPYRDRFSHLVRLLDFLYPILQRQLLDFRFIVTEQYGDNLFNKGRIMNAAFKLAEKLGVDCVIFHDVDMFPQDDRTPYDCPSTPRHVGAFVSNLGYQLWYAELVGGVLAMNMEDYRAVNGYSNMYWAWGGEDDDMGKRIMSQNMTIERPDREFARFSMLKHGKRKRIASKMIYSLLGSAGTRWLTDGLNVENMWKIVKLEQKPLYYHLLVDVGTPPDDWHE
uniref:Beta-1,4-N-acetylgalactosaminyltransferase n=1 Tax=Panagrellus redivivus TaxID=6233 RepID=A0A7E4ZVJ9_PANRE